MRQDYKKNSQLKIINILFCSHRLRLFIMYTFYVSNFKFLIKTKQNKTKQKTKQNKTKQKQKQKQKQNKKKTPSN